MHLMYSLDEQGKRVYTLKVSCRAGTTRLHGRTEGGLACVLRACVRVLV